MTATGNTLKRVEFDGKTYQTINGIYYHANTPANLIIQLESIRANRTRVSLYYGNTATGMQWDDRPESGRIGNSMGPIKIPILVNNRRSLGGGGILDSSIVKITTTTGDKAILYVHSNFHIRPPEWDTWRNAFIVARGGLANTVDARPDSPTSLAWDLSKTAKVYDLFIQGVTADDAAKAV